MAAAAAMLMLGVALLIWGADLTVDGATAAARRLRVPAVVVGALVVGVGTSLPEAVVSGVAVGRGAYDLGVGNILGSNVANLAILGLAAAWMPIRATRADRGLVAAACVATVAFAAAALRPASAAAAATLAVLLVVGIVVILRSSDDDSDDSDDSDDDSDGGWRDGVKLAAGIVGLTVGAQATVDGATTIATTLGVADGVVGLAIVAIGTSLPELAATVRAARAGAAGLAIGTLLGSNLMNATFIGTIVVGIGAATGATADLRFAVAGVAAMLAYTGAVAVTLAWRGRVGRGAGVALAAAYIPTVALITLL